MKLNKFIWKKLTTPQENSRALTENRIEEWILEYNETLTKNKLPLEYKNEIK